jgi:hypothetical protein
VVQDLPYFVATLAPPPESACIMRMATSSVHRSQLLTASPARALRRIQGLGGLLSKAEHGLQLAALYAALALIAGVAIGTLPVRPF